MKMRNSLLLKLMGAFLLVIAIGAVVISLLTANATRSAFDIYTTRSGQAYAQSLAPSLAEYYIQNGGWNGVDAVLHQQSSGMMAGMMGQGHGAGYGRQTQAPMMNLVEQRLILTDSQGVVISDTTQEWVGTTLSAGNLQNGVAVMANNQQVGTIIVIPSGIIDNSSPSGEFLASVNQAILSSAAIAGVIAVILGGLLFFQITSPLRKLRRAASAIANGDLQQRVDIRSRDEFGELGSTFNRMAESLEDAEQQRKHMVADVAHELRTPLAAIQATLEGMQDGVLPLDREQIDALHEETDLLNRLVGDLRLLSLADAGQLQLERQIISPVDFLLRVAERAKPHFAAKGVDLETDIPDDLPTVMIDADRMAQVLNNLINNALRYTPAGGKIILKAARSGRWMQFLVMDSGSGISAADLPHIFDRFYRGDKSRSRASGGSGLGLAITKQLVEAHDGRIEVQSPTNPDGSGTTFRISLPI